MSVLPAVHADSTRHSRRSRQTTEEGSVAPATAAEYAVERELQAAKPISALKWTAPRSVLTVDRRSVANPIQVGTLLEAVREQQRSGPRMVAYYACLYFAALRPEEAASLAKHHLALPDVGWGEFHLDGAEPLCRVVIRRPQRAQSR